MFDFLSLFQHESNGIKQAAIIDVNDDASSLSKISEESMTTPRSSTSTPPTPIAEKPAEQIFKESLNFSTQVHHQKIEEKPSDHFVFSPTTKSNQQEIVATKPMQHEEFKPIVKETSPIIMEFSKSELFYEDLLDWIK